CALRIYPVDDGVAGGEHVEPASHVVRARGVRHEEGVLGWEGEDAGLVIEDPGGRQPGEDLGRVALVEVGACRDLAGRSAIVLAGPAEETGSLGDGEDA